MRAACSTTESLFSDADRLRVGRHPPAQRGTIRADSVHVSSTRQLIRPEKRLSDRPVRLGNSIQKVAIDLQHRRLPDHIDTKNEPIVADAGFDPAPYSF